jgi:ribosome-binding protein aMBF1 (putative translation factor)
VYIFAPAHASVNIYGQLARATKGNTMTRQDKATLRQRYLEGEQTSLNRHPQAEIMLGPIQHVDALEQEIETQLIAQTVGDLLKKAREQSGKTQRAVATALSLSPSRVHALEHSENLEIATLAQAARILGYRLVLRLEPDDESRVSVVHHSKNSQLPH